MSLFALQFQVASDLHLETPVMRPCYPSYRLVVKASNLCLLGDIGLAKDEGLFSFLRRLLEEYMGTRIFYVLGNHEPYGMTLDGAVQKFRAFQQESKAKYGGRFIFLHRDRYDIDVNTSVLGCTLWTAILPDQASEAQMRLTDFNEQRGIRNWTLESHLEQHKRDVDWLNTEVVHLQQTEPHRQIVVFTHHSPTLQSNAIAPQHKGSSLSSGFATELSNQPCWKSPAVKLWGFGHTHYSCAFQDETTGKLIVANQRGYSSLPGDGRLVKTLNTLLIEAAPETWRIVKSTQRDGAKPAPSKVVQAPSNIMTVFEASETTAAPAQPSRNKTYPHKSFGLWVKIQRLFRGRS